MITFTARCGKPTCYWTSEPCASTEAALAWIKRHWSYSHPPEGEIGEPHGTIDEAQEA